MKIGDESHSWFLHQAPHCLYTLMGRDNLIMPLLPVCWQNLITNFLFHFLLPLDRPSLPALLLLVMEALELLLSSLHLLKRFLNIFWFLCDGVDVCCCAGLWIGIMQVVLILFVRIIGRKETCCQSTSSYLCRRSFFESNFLFLLMFLQNFF